MNSILKKILKKTILPLYYLVVEKDCYSWKTPVYKQVVLSLKYRLVGLGILVSKNEKDLIQLKNKYAGKRCFIIGNGPSLNLLDLKLLKGEFTFGVNAIYLNYDKMQFDPTFYVVEDYLVAEDRADEINKYIAPKIKFFGNYLRYTLNKSDNTILLNVKRNYSNDKDFPLFSKECERVVGVGGTVSFICLQLAYYMGFSEVYLVGFDHSYKVANQIDVVKSVMLSKEDDVNHFSKDYFGKGYRWHDPMVERMEVGYLKAREVFNADGRNVYNATAGGQLEVFPRVEYSSLFKDDANK